MWATRADGRGQTPDWLCQPRVAYTAPPPSTRGGFVSPASPRVERGGHSGPPRPRRWHRVELGRRGRPGRQLFTHRISGAMAELLRLGLVTRHGLLFELRAGGSLPACAVDFRRPLVAFPSEEGGPLGGARLRKMAARGRLRWISGRPRVSGTRARPHILRWRFWLDGVGAILRRLPPLRPISAVCPSGYGIFA